MIGALVILGLVGFVLFSKGQKKAKRDAQLARWHQLVDRADLASLKAAATEAGTVLSEEATGTGAVAAIDSRAQLLIYLLYSGADQQRFRATQSLETARERGPFEPEVLLSQALWEAALGDPARALDILDGGGASTRGEVAEAARAEALLRSGKLDGAAQATAGVTTPLGRTWAMRVAWRAGDMDAVATHADAVVSTVSSNETGRVMQALAAARTSASADGSAAEPLGAMLESEDAPLSARNAALVTVELSRQIRRAGQSDKADALLERYLEQDESSAALQLEYARVQRYQGLFGASRTRSDKALRGRADHPELLSEMAQALFFNDAPVTIRDRVNQSGDQSGTSDGVVRALAIAAIIEGNFEIAIDGLRKTRHVGVPGEAELWLAEAHLQAGQADLAKEEAAKAVALLTSSTGAGSREVTTARMYEGLAVAAMGDVDAGRELLKGAFVDPNRTPWGAWLYGRFHEVAQDPRSAKDAYLLACHNGQDFSLSCFDLARLYDSLPGNAVTRRTQKQAREHYLRSSPNGWHADEVRAALDR